MKTLLRSVMVSAVGLYGLQLVLPGVVISGGWRTLLLAALVLSVLNKVVKPVVNLLLLPITVLTLGLARGAVNVVTLWLLAVIVGGVSFTGFAFPGYSLRGFSAPPLAVTPLVSLVLAAFGLSLVTSVLEWLLD